MARSKIDDINLIEVEKLASRGLTQQQIADALGISDRTLRKYRDQFSDFSDAIKKGKAKGIARVTNKLFEKIETGDTTSIIFFLKTQGGWKEASKVEHTIDDTNQSNQLDLEKLSDEELREFVRLSNKASKEHSGEKESN